nr:exostosin 2 [Hymenolepis microstoma]
MLFVDEKGNYITYHGNQEFRELLNALNSSKYAVQDPSRACLFVVSMDFVGSFNQNSSYLLDMALSFPWMNNNQNHLLFGSLYNLSFGRNFFDIQHFPGLVASGGMNSSYFRNTYDVSIPIVSNFDTNYHNKESNLYYLAIPQIHIGQYLTRYADKFNQIVSWSYNNNAYSKTIISKHTSSHPHIYLILQADNYSFKEIVASVQVVLSSSVFCLIDPSQPPLTLLFDTMKAGCIPVFTSSDIVLPFSEKVDWTKCSLTIPSGQLKNVMDIIFSYSYEEVTFLQQMVEHVFNKYMSSITAIVTTTLDIINSRVFPESSPLYYDWNDPHNQPNSAILDISFPSLGQGICNQFTVLLITSHHLMYTVSIMNFLSTSRYVRGVFIIYTGDSTDFSSTFITSQTELPVKIVSPFYNTLEQTINPLPETQSAAFLYVGDDVILPSDISYIDFAYEAWCQYPNRVVTLTPFTKSLKSKAAFFHKVYAVRVLELLPTTLNSLVSGEKPSCIETMLPELVTHISGRSDLPVSVSWPSNTTQASSEVSAHRKRCIKLLADNHLVPSANEQQSMPSFVIEQF